MTTAGAPDSRPEMTSLPRRDEAGTGGTFSWFVFGLMASVTFVGILSELVPSGILPQMAEGLDISESQVGSSVCTRWRLP